MIDFTSLLISPAFAQTTDTASASGDMMMQFIPFFLILGVFYFLLIRPQQKKLEAQDTMLKNLKKGDKIVTNGGVIGTITKIESDEYIIVEVADGIRIRLLRSGVNSLVKPEEAKAKNDNPKTEKKD